MAQGRARFGGRWVHALGLALFSGCLLNPQPVDPLAEDDGDGPASGGAGASSSVGTGGATTGAPATGGGPDTGGGGLAACPDCSRAGAAGAASPDGEDPCRAAGNAPLLDDGDACDEVTTDAEGRRGRWFAYDSGAALGGAQLPAAEGPFRLELDPERGCAVHVTGGGYPAASADPPGFAGVGLVFLDAAAARCAGGYDAAVYGGLAFAARGVGGLRVLVETLDTPPLDGRPNGYVRRLPLTEQWATIETPWSDFALLFAAAGLPPRVDPTRIVSIRFEPELLTTYEFWLDDLVFQPQPQGDGGAAGLLEQAGAAGSR